MPSDTPGVVIHEQSRLCGACGAPVAFLVKVPGDARLDPKALTVRDVRCAAHLATEKREALQRGEDVEANTSGTAGRCQVCQGKIAILVEFPPGVTYTIDSMRMLHEACAVPGVKKAG